jgi:hypothetical protein
MINNDVTLFITSCGRPDLLKITLESFIKYNTYPIKEAIICEDSGINGIIDLRIPFVIFHVKSYIMKNE